LNGGVPYDPQPAPENSAPPVPVHAPARCKTSKDSCSMFHSHYYMHGGYMHGGLLFLGIGLMVALVVFFLHFLPSYIGFSRYHPARWAILVLNLFFGWTVVGWLLLLVWALMAPPTVVVYPPYPPYPPPPPPGGRPW
jgi:hypothetical protein